MEGSKQKGLGKFIRSYSEKYNPNIDLEEEIEIKNEELLNPLAFFDYTENVENLCITILKAINGEGEKLEKLKLNPLIPLAEEAKKLEDYFNPPIEEINEWLKKI